jgi:hypothetical protein
MAVTITEQKEDQPLEELITALAGPPGQWTTWDDYYFWDVNGVVEYIYKLEKDSSDRYDYHRFSQSEEFLLPDLTGRQLQFLLNQVRHSETNDEILLQLDLLALERFPTVHSFRRPRSAS